MIVWSKAERAAAKWLAGRGRLLPADGYHGEAA